MYDPVHHAESGKISTLLKGVPAKVCYHFCYTTFSSVIICNKSGCSSLDHLNLIGVCVGGWCPGCSGIFLYRTDKVYVLQAVSFAACGSDLMFLLRNPMVKFAFFATLSACLFQDKSLLMVTPRYFASVFTFNSGCIWYSLSKWASF